MNLKTVGPKFTKSVIGFLTKVAAIGAALNMSPNVLSKVSTSCKALLAKSAVVWPFTGMLPLMHLEV